MFFLALGTRLGLQQTDLIEEFTGIGKIIHVDIDKEELKKHHPKTDFKINYDANLILENLLKFKIKEKPDWINYCEKIKKYFPLIEKITITNKGFFLLINFTLIYPKLQKIKMLSHMQQWRCIYNF